MSAILLVPGPTFEAVIPSHFVFPVHFNHFYVVKENASYTLFIGAFI